MNANFHPDAQAELNHAIGYYEANQPGLAYQFAIEVFAAVKRIKAYPTLWPLMDDRQLRRCLIHRFPYGVIYALDEEEAKIYILAVMHLHREPGYWSERA